MAYCTYSDVDALMSVTHDTTTTPTAVTVTDFCADISAELDGVMQAVGYVVPITGATGLALLNSYATMGAAVRAWHAGFQSSNAPANVEYWDTTYRDFLMRLKKGDQTIPDETTEDGTSTPHAFSVAPKAARYWSAKRDQQAAESG